jgi:hypothetical protein
MRWKKSSLQTRLYIIAAIILLVGLGGAVLIYVTAEKPSDSALLYDSVHSKKHRHDLELIGGKINVLADEFCRWSVALWHGKSLAFIVAAIAVFVSFGFFFVAYHLPPSSGVFARDQNHPGGVGTLATEQPTGCKPTAPDDSNTS